MDDKDNNVLPTTAASGEATLLAAELITVNCLRRVIWKLSDTQPRKSYIDLLICAWNWGQSLERSEICEPMTYKIRPMNASNNNTESMEAALRGSRNFFSKNIASGNNKMENRQENINGDKTSFPRMTR